MNNITIELCAEDRQRLDRLIGALEHGATAEDISEVRYWHSPESCSVVASVGLKDANTCAYAGLCEISKGEYETLKAEYAKPAEPPTVDPAFPLDTPEQAAAGKTDSRPAGELRGELRKKCLTLSAAGRKHEALAVLKQYAASITDIPDDKCADALAAMVALEG